MAFVSKTIGLIAFILTLSLVRPGLAADDPDLYRTQTIVTGQGEENRARGLAKCLEDVLVKVSGDPALIGDPAVIALGDQARTFVADFRYHDRMSGIPVHDEQGTRDRPHDLIVAFDPAKIDAALHQLGRKPWRNPRPQLVVILNVDNGARRFVLTRDGEQGHDMRDALDAAADRFGMPVMLPDRTLSETISNAGMGPARSVFGGDHQLLGNLVWNQATLGWVADWSLPVEGKLHRWEIRGVSFDEAFRSAIRGAAQVLSGHGSPG